MAVAFGTAEAELLAGAVALAEEVEEAGAAEDAEPEVDGAAVPWGAGVQAETARATLTAIRASPRTWAVPGSFTGVSFLWLTPGPFLQFSQWPGIVLPL